MPEDKIQESEVTIIRCTHGDTALYPLADMEVEVEGRKLMVEPAISETLPMSVLLGTDVTELKEILEGPRGTSSC